VRLCGAASFHLSIPETLCVASPAGRVVSHVASATARQPWSRGADGDIDGGLSDSVEGFHDMSSTSSGRYDDESSKATFVSGVSTFAGILLILIAAFQILDGIAAIANDTVFVGGFDYIWKFDVTGWGWIHLIIGLGALGAGIGILMAQTWGQLIGILIAGISALANFMFMPYYPFWSLAVIALDVLIIWALCREIANERV
jgi:hypothetical protein